METTLAMPKKGLGSDLVAECTGLSEREILRPMENPRNNG
jgi:hypothetical protein